MAQPKTCSPRDPRSRTNATTFLDRFRPRLSNPQTGESWIQRPSPVDVFLASAAAACALLFFVVMSLAIVAHAHKGEGAPAQKSQRKAAPPVHRIHPPPKSIAERNAHMFAGSQQALDQLGTFPGELPSKPPTESAQRTPKTNDSTR